MKVLFSLLASIFSIFYLQTKCVGGGSSIKLAPIPNKRVIFILNRGVHGATNASLSYYSPNKKKGVNRIFSQVNGKPLGDAAVEMNIKNHLGYITTGRSSKLKVIDLTNFRLINEKSGFIYPHFIHFVNDEKAYVTLGLDKKIIILHPKTLNIIGRISLPYPSGRMVQNGDLLLAVTHCMPPQYLGGKKCPSTSPLLIIDTKTDQIKDSIEVYKYARDIVIDKNDQIWLIHGGFEEDVQVKTPRLTRINLKTLKTKEFELPASDSFYWNLGLNQTKDTLYWEEKHGVWRMPITEENIPSEVFIPAQPHQYFCGLGIDPKNGDIYVGDALDRKKNGMMYRYSEEGELLDTLKVGIEPFGFAFYEKP